MTVLRLKHNTSMKNGSRKGCFTSLLVAFLLVLLIGEIFLQKMLVLDSLASASCRKFVLPLLSILSDPSSFKPVIQTGPSIHQAFTNEAISISAISKKLAPTDIRTHFEANNNILGYGLSVARNICFDPDGRILVVGMTQEEVDRSLKAYPSLDEVWHTSYNCSWGCIGSAIVSQAPQNALWVEGNTTHVIPYLGNVFHNFAERVWPHVAGFQPPLSFTTNNPITHIAIHRLPTWLDQAHHNNERSTFLYQFLMLGRLSSPPADFPLIPETLTQSVCYERLTLDCSACDRISNFLGSSIVSPALLSYRSTTLSYFNLAEPHVSLPPRPLRVTFYGRGDASRRRVINALEVVEHLRSWRQPLLEVTFIDELLASGQYNQTFPEVVSLFSQTDIFITVHGANTWAALFMPRGAAVIEIYGPCGPGTWLQTISTALELKHSTESNPWKEAFASPRAGNTTKCESALQTPDFSLDIEKLDTTIHELARPSGPGDRIPLHWLYNWTAGRYDALAT